MLRRLAKDVAVYGMGDLIVKAIMFLQSSLYIKILLFSRAEMGLWGSAMAVVGLWSAILAMGMDSAFALFYFEARDDAQRRAATSTAMIFTVGLTVPVVTAVSLFSESMAGWLLDDSHLKFLLQLAMWLIPLQLLHALGGQALRNQMRPRSFVAMNLLTAVASVTGGILAVRTGWGRVEGVMLGSMIGFAAALPVRIWMVRDLLEWVFDKALMWRMISYGAPLVAVALAYWISGSSSRLVILNLRGQDEAGLFAVAANLTVVLTMVNGAIGQAWSPHAFKAHQQNKAHASQLFGRVLTLILAGFGVLCVGFCTFGREGLLILAKPEFLPAEPAIMPMALGAYALASTQVTAMGISISKKTRFLGIYAWIAAGVFLGITRLLVPQIGFAGCAWATLASNVVLTLLYCRKSQQLLPVTYQQKRAVVLIGLTLAGCLATRWLPGGLTVGYELLKVVYCAVFTIGAAVVAFAGVRGAPALHA